MGSTRQVVDYWSWLAGYIGDHKFKKGGGTHGQVNGNIPVTIEEEVEVLFKDGTSEILTRSTAMTIFRNPEDGGPGDLTAAVIFFHGGKRQITIKVNGRVVRRSFG